MNMVGWTLGLGTLLLGAAALHLVRRARRAVMPGTFLRFGALLAVLATGTLLGTAGVWLTGHEAWYLAIPGTLALGWLALANPLACQPPDHASPAPGRDNGADTHAGTPPR